MYNSGITADALINSVRLEADISIPVSNDLFLRTINTVEQFIYTEILREYVKQDFEGIETSEECAIDLEDFDIPDDVSAPIFDDIIRVFADDEELERSGVSGVVDFPEKKLYYNKYDGKITLSLNDFCEKITVIYRLRPALKTSENSDSAIIALPVEFVELLAARIRGEMYKIANEDGLSAKWLSEYNVQLENFKIWAAERTSRFGG